MNSTIKILLLTFTAMLPFKSRSIGCRYRDLSTKYDYSISARFRKHKTPVIFITVSSKAPGAFYQKINVSKAYWFIRNVPVTEGMFVDCNAARSLSTGHNRDMEVVNRDYGDLVVADFNFDGMDDFAVKMDRGSNEGAHYAFYVSGARGFTLETSLTDWPSRFPDEIDTVEKSLSYSWQNNADSNIWQKRSFFYRTDLEGYEEVFYQYSFE